MAEDESFLYDGSRRHGLRCYEGVDVGSVSVSD